ncbi:hypothetical protein EXT47_22580 [Pseudoalteromonas sp. CO342X]|nr:hypothetical protein EXT47_22580 [Pseudoalteromonas sp. CO342X]
MCCSHLMTTYSTLITTITNMDKGFLCYLNL